MEAAKNLTFSADFEIVESGWDPQQVTSVIRAMQQSVADLESRLESAEAQRAARTVETNARIREEIIASAEHNADEIRDRALALAKRLRSRGGAEGREITVQARREALDVVKRARVDADRLTGAARAQEALLWERVQHLQTVVQRTEALLREVADAGLTDVFAAAPVSTGTRPDGIEVVVAAEQSRVERRLQSVPQERADLPPSVERLLNALKTGGLPDV